MTKLTYYVGEHDGVIDICSATFGRRHSPITMGSSQQRNPGPNISTSKAVTPGYPISSRVTAGRANTPMAATNRIPKLWTMVWEPRNDDADRILQIWNVRIAVRGRPMRIGICCCVDCRQESGCAFTFL